MWFVQFLNLRVDFEDEELPLVNVDDLKSPTRNFKKLVKTSQTATRWYCKPRMQQTAHGAMICCPMDVMGSTPPRILEKGRSVDQPRPAIQSIRGKAQSSTDHFRREDPSAADESHSLRREGRRSVVRMRLWLQTL